MTDEPMTPDEAEEWAARFSPDDRADALAHFAKHPGDPVWIAALELADGGGSGKKSKAHRRGRRG